MERLGIWPRLTTIRYDFKRRGEMEEESSVWYLELDVPVVYQVAPHVLFGVGPPARYPCFGKSVTARLSDHVAVYF